LSVDLEWRPFCGQEYGGGGGLSAFRRHVAGDPIVCDKNPHPASEKHKNYELGFEWWGDDDNY
jgi:hypothetical protein